MANSLQHIGADKAQAITQAVASYGTGVAAMTLPSFMEIANYAQALAIILGAVVVAVRLIHDSIKLYRLLKEKKSGH